MRLGDFLRNHDLQDPSPTHPVSFRVVGKNKRGEDFTMEANAVLAFVDEDKRTHGLHTARATLRPLYPQGELPAVELSNEQAYQLLLHALRDADDPRVQFAENVDQLKRALVKPVAERLYADYQKFVDEEFPEVVSPEQLAELTNEAEKNS
jgi:hypothetical protein